MSNAKIDYNQLLQEVEYTIEKLTIDIITNNVYKSSKAEERLTALCSTREYIKEKIEQLKNIEEAPLMSLFDIEGVPNEVNNEG